MSIRRVALCAVLMVVVALTPAASADDPPPISTTITDVGAARSASGAPNLVMWTARHDITAHVDPNTGVPGARISADEYPAAFDGVWGPDSGDVGAWLTPGGIPFLTQFVPRSHMVDSSYFLNHVPAANGVSPAALPMEAGDHAEIAFGDWTSNAPLPWDRTKGQADGSLEWDLTTEFRTVSANYGTTSGSMDAVFFQADLVARGGDIAASHQTVDAPPLVFDLGKTYGADASATYISTMMFPYTHYVADTDLRVLPQLGKAVFQASVKGYVYEAREYTRPDGSRVNEWHIPIRGVIMLKGEEGPLAPLASMTLPEPAIATVGNGVTEKTFRVAAGEPIVSAEKLATEPSDPEDAPQQGEAPAVTEELDAAAAIDDTLSAPVSLVTGNRHFSLTIDPDFRGEGLLALRDIEDLNGRGEFFNVLSVPYVRMDGTVVKLDRSKLVDLRFIPEFRGIGLAFTGTSNEIPSRARTIQGWVNYPGFTLSAVYDVGQGRYAFVDIEGIRETGFTPRVMTRVVVRSLSGYGVAVSPVQYAEISESGPVTYQGETHHNEFATAMDELGGADFLTIGDHELHGSILVSGVDGVATFVNPDSPMTAYPQANPEAPLAGDKLGVFYSSPSDGLPQYFGSMFYLLLAPKTAATDPKPLGAPCGAPQIVDLRDQAIDALDVTSAWLDSDEANIYFTIKVANLPTATLSSDVSYTYAFHWRHEHSARFARAVLDGGGNWTFGSGWSNLASALPSYFDLSSVPATGEVRPGADGVIRVAVPRSALDYRDGELMREVGAFTSVTRGSTVGIDAAPDGSDRAYGNGGDYRVGSDCEEVEPSPTPTESPMPETTEVVFTAGSETSGQHTDKTLFEARLTDSDGDPIPAQELTFELIGEESRGFRATTDENGVASVTPTLTEKPGPHQLTVRFAGDDDHAGDADTVSFVVAKEDSALELSVEGEDDDKTLRARLSDLDTSSEGIAGRTIDFYSDGELIGSHPTDANGVASVALSPRHRGNNRTYAAVFEGDDFYLGSSDERAGKGKDGNGGGSGGNGGGDEDGRTYAGRMLLM